MSKTDISVRQLIDKVQHGELLLPEMQRRYVWPATRVRDLLDSLYRSYPSGTILVWETDEDIETKELAVKATKSPTTSQRLLLLDGQQRITSLAAILSGQQVHVRHRVRPIEILFNLEHPDAPVEVLEVEENDLSGGGEDSEDEENGQRESKRNLKTEPSSLRAEPYRQIPHGFLFQPFSRRRTEKSFAVWVCLLTILGGISSPSVFSR